MWPSEGFTLTSGSLVDQDPTDEPASVLRERIRAEREARARTKDKEPGVDETP